MHAFATALLGAAASFAAVASASAGPLTAAAILGDYNVVIAGNATTTADIEGAAAIGGNFSGATIYNNPPALRPSGALALTVFGSTSGNSINIDNSGNAYVAGSKGAPISFNGGGYAASPGTTIASDFAPLQALSSSLAGLTPTGTLPSPGNNEVITATPGAGGVAVFDLTASQLSAIPSFSINLNGATSVIFNVGGSTVNFSANDESGTAYADDIIWNFYQATSVDIVTQIGGAVFAVDAHVTNSNQIDGTLVANSWTGQGELHDYPFTPALPGTPTGSDSLPIPEPGTLPLFGAALAGLLFVRRRAA